LDEVSALQPVYATTQVLGGEGKKLHLFNRLFHEDGRLLATGEHMLLHVSLETRGSCLPLAGVAEKLAGIAEAHAGLDVPEGAGRAIG
jgi:carnitine 3-dehydrogenase